MSEADLNRPVSDNDEDRLITVNNDQEEVITRGSIQNVSWQRGKISTADGCCSLCRVPLRYTVAVLGFVGFFCAFASRGCINVAIVVMVNSTADDDGQLFNTSADRCPPRDGQNVTIRPSPQIVTFDWSAETCSLVLGSFYYGYAISQLPGGLLSTYWKPQHVFGLTVSVSGLLCVLMPFMAQCSVNLLITARFLMGFVQGPLYPSSLAVAGQWSPAFERSTIVVLIVSGSTLGDILSPVITGLLCDSQLVGGWPAAFYLFGLVSCLWYVAWLVVARHDMPQHPWISQDEKQHILQSSHSDGTPPPSCPPWKLIFTSPAVYGLLLQTLLDGAGFYIIYTCYPTYMKTVLNYDITQDSLLTAAPPLASFITGLIAGPAADLVITRRWLSVTVTRKLFTLVGGMAMAGFIAGVGFVDCDHILAVTLLTVSWAFSGLIGVGPHISALDMSPQHAGVLNGIVNSVNSVGGFLSPLLVELLTKGQPSRSRWQLVFFITASLHASGNLAYVVLGTSREQQWTATASDADVNAPSVSADTDENAPLVADNVPNSRAYGTIGDVVS